jgi:hypothetical protein
VHGTIHRLLSIIYCTADSAKSEFGKYGLTDAEEIKEPIKDLDDKPSQRFWFIVCKKEND